MVSVSFSVEKSIHQIERDLTFVRDDDILDDRVSPENPFQQLNQQQHIIQIITIKQENPQESERDHACDTEQTVATYSTNATAERTCYSISGCSNCCSARCLKILVHIKCSPTFLHLISMATVHLPKYNSIHAWHRAGAQLH